MPTPEYHAVLGPSSAKRWLSCPASVRLSEGISAKTSQYAAAGTAAHAIAELKARKRFMVMNTRTFKAQLKKLQENEYYSPEMEAYTDQYVEVLEQHAMSFSAPPFIALETSVPIGSYTGEYKEDGSPATGTADCIQIGDDVLWVTDYKNGSGVPVDAEDNPQMKMYALGALALYGMVYGDSIKRVRMTIVQPALKSVSDWETTREALEDWGASILRPTAEKALRGDPGDPNPGDWCRFCPAKYLCRGRADKVTALEAFGRKMPPMLTDAEVGDILTRGADLVSWYNDLKDYALKACLEGKEIPGYKAVAGRTSRDWADLDAAFEVMKSRGVEEALLWERKPVTVAALEKALSKKVFAVAADGQVVTSPGKPTLVPASDKRPAYSAAAAAFGKAGSDG